MATLIGILGGTFDPIHIGHLHIARQLLQQLCLEEIQFIPCYQPNHRQAPIASPQQRLEMLNLALATEQKMHVNNCEIVRQGISYTVDTLYQLKQSLPNHNLALILGADAFTSLPQWYRWQEILQLAHIIVVNRPNYILDQQPSISKLLQQHQIIKATDLQHDSYGKILICTLPPCPISATTIRQANTIQAMKPMLPNAVYCYVCDNHLYV